MLGLCSALSLSPQRAKTVSIPNGKVRLFSYLAGSNGLVNDIVNQLLLGAASDLKTDTIKET